MVDHKLPKELGEKVNVSCKATGNPIPSINWVKKTASDGHVPVTDVDLKNHTLRINSLLEEHYGDYMCLAENKFGNDTVVLSLGKYSCPYGLVGAVYLTSFRFKPWSILLYRILEGNAHRLQRHSAQKSVNNDTGMVEKLWI